MNGTDNQNKPATKAGRGVVFLGERDGQMRVRFEGREVTLDGPDFERMRSKAQQAQDTPSAEGSTAAEQSQVSTAPVGAEPRKTPSAPLVRDTNVDRGGVPVLIRPAAVLASPDNAQVAGAALGDQGDHQMQNTAEVSTPNAPASKQAPSAEIAASPDMNAAQAPEIAARGKRKTPRPPPAAVQAAQEDGPPYPHGSEKAWSRHVAEV